MSRHLSGVGLLCLLLSAGCNDATDFSVDPQIVTDTVELGAPGTPSANLPTALDITSIDLESIGGGRFPERVSDVGLWDFAVRYRGGELALVPASALGLDPRGRLRTGITRPLGGTFEGLREAPPRRDFVTDSAVVMQTGAVYAAFSRPVSIGVGSCEQYAKLQPLDVNPATGRLRLRIVTNARGCDPRLELED